MPDNQTPEQAARERIDQQLRASGWEVQSLAELDPSAARGVAVREYSTDRGPMDYLLMVDSEPLGLIEAKREEEGHCMSKVEEQSARYAGAELKHVGRADLRFVYEATGTITRFTDRRDPAPRARELFQFHRPETLAKWNSQAAPFRERLQTLPELQNDPRWDYVVAHAETLHFIEVHPAYTSAVEEMRQKLEWLKGWLGGKALEHPESSEFHWIASGKVAILPQSRQMRRAAETGLEPKKHLQL